MGLRKAGNGFTEGRRAEKGEGRRVAMQNPCPCKIPNKLDRQKEVKDGKRNSQVLSNVLYNRLLEYLEPLKKIRIQSPLGTSENLAAETSTSRPQDTGCMTVVSRIPWLCQFIHFQERGNVRAIVRNLPSSRLTWVPSPTPQMVQQPVRSEPWE